MNTKKGFAPLILLVVVAVLAVGGGVYYYSQNFPITDPPTTPENSGWKTYTNTQYGFSIQYPSSLEVINTVFISINPKGHVGDDYQFRIESDTAQSYVDFKKSHPYILKDKEYLLDSIKTRKLLVGSDLGIDFNYILFTRNGVNYAISYYGDITTQEQILSTFKFTSTNTQTPNSDDFAFRVGDNYAMTKTELTARGWTVVMIPSQTPASSVYPEISNCGSGISAICNVDFQKGNIKRHLNVQSGVGAQAGQWFVVGSE